MDVAVFLSKALICFAGTCQPVLVGDKTPTGSFELQQRIVISEGYGGDVLVFDEDETSWRAVHRTYRNLPNRVAAYGKLPASRRRVTNGCINVTPAVYDMLLECCNNSTIEVLE